MCAIRPVRPAAGPDRLGAALPGRAAAHHGRHSDPQRAGAPWLPWGLVHQVLGGAHGDRSSGSRLVQPWSETIGPHAMSRRPDQG